MKICVQGGVVPTPAPALFRTAGYDCLDKPVIRKLAETIGGLFPLGACESIALANGAVTMMFSAPQDVPIPNSWRQASLKISERLVLRCEEGGEKKTTAQCRTHWTATPEVCALSSIRGYVQLDFSFLLRIFGRRFRDGQGSELLYRINNQKKVSSLSLIESTSFTRENFSVTDQAPGADPQACCWIDIRHPDFPDEKDIGLAANKLSFMGGGYRAASEPDDPVRRRNASLRQ